MCHPDPGKQKASFWARTVGVALRWLIFPVFSPVSCCRSECTPCEWSQNLLALHRTVLALHSEAECLSCLCVCPTVPSHPPPQRASWRWGPLSLPFWGYIMQVPFFWGSGSHSVLRLEVVVGNSALFLEGFPTWRMLRGSWGKMNDLVKWPPDCTFTAKNMVTWHFQCLLWPSRVACRLGFHCCLHLGAPQGRWPGTGSELSTCLTYDPLTSVLFHIHRG